MNYGMVFKPNSQLNLHKNKTKYTSDHNATANNTFIPSKEANRIAVDTFRKGSLRESNASLGLIVNKAKTSKNSPNHFSSKRDKAKDQSKSSMKQSDDLQLHNLQLNSIFSTSKIKKLFNENIGFDSLFKRKMQMINNKHLNNPKGQITYSNIYSNLNSNNSKNLIEKSLYQKISKNESFVGKRSTALDDDSLMHNYNKKLSSPKLLKNSSNIDQDSSLGDLKHMKTPIFNNSSNNGFRAKEINLSQLKNLINSSSTNRNSQVEAYEKICYNNVNDVKAGNKRPMSSSSSVHSSSQKVKEEQSGNANGNCSLFKQIEKMNLFANSNIISEFKKMSHTSFPSKSNSKKNSFEKQKEGYMSNCNANANSSASSSLILRKYNEVFSGSSKLNESKRSSSNATSKKYLKDNREKYQSLIHNSSNSQNMIMLNSFTPSMTSKPSSIINQCLLNNQLKTGSTPNSLSDIKFIEYVTSNMKNYSTTKNSCNKLIKKKKENDYFLTKLKVMGKASKFLTTVQSKQNSKSSSRIEEYLNIPPSNHLNSNCHINEDIFSGMTSKGKKAGQMYSLISQKMAPREFCASPISQEIQRKVALKKKGDQEGELKAKKAEFQYGADCLKVTPSSVKHSTSLARIDEIKLSELDIASLERKLNETSESIQSTARECVFYKKEMEKVALYIMKYLTIHKVYPPSMVQFYKFGRIIGKGAFGKVNLALHICSGRLVAIKSFNKAKQKSKHAKNKIKNEIEVLKQLQHPFISQ